MGFRTRFASLFRAEQWWEYKIVPTLCCFYATSLLLDRSIISLWPALLMLLFALMPGAVYVSVTNDIADRESDLAAGKANRMVGVSLPAQIVMVALPLLIGVGFLIYWRDSLGLVLAYLAAWIVFSLYSIPPFRWKARGLLGVLADAAGAHLFPSLVAVFLAYRAGNAPVDFIWLAAVGAWAFAYGLRGILWHQLLDLENDRIAGVGTFAQRHSAEIAQRLAKYFALPLELVALTIVLWKIPSISPLLSLVIYGGLVLTRVVFARRPLPVVVGHGAGYSILFHEYYDVLLPASILIAAAMRFPADFVLLALHFVLFPQRLTQLLVEIFALGKNVSSAIQKRIKLVFKA